MKCKNCENDAIKYSKYSNGNFCSKSCACSYSTKEKRLDINKKVSLKLFGTGNDDIKKICKQCKNNFIVKFKNRKRDFCSNKCSSIYREENNIEYKIKKILSLKKIYEDPEKRKRMRDIGKLGGFGKKGYTKNGTYYQSTFEKKML